jgi:hypothetical protein
MKKHLFIAIIFSFFSLSAFAVVIDVADVDLTMTVSTPGQPVQVFDVLGKRPIEENQLTIADDFYARLVIESRTKGFLAQKKAFNQRGVKQTRQLYNKTVSILRKAKATGRKVNITSDFNVSLL